MNKFAYLMIIIIGLCNNSSACYYTKEDIVDQAIVQAGKLLVSVERVKTLADLNIVIDNLNAQVSVFSQLNRGIYNRQITASLRKYIKQLAIAKKRWLSATSDQQQYAEPVQVAITKVRNYFDIARMPCLYGIRHYRDDESF